MEIFSNKNIKDEALCKENILKYISEYDVYNYYVPNIQVGGITNSPFRDDPNPSFGIFVGNSGELAFNDFNIGGGDFVKFVSLIHGCSYKDALSVINNIFHLGLIDTIQSKIEKNNNIKAKITNYKPKKKKIKIQIKKKIWTPDDIEYWYPLDVNNFIQTIPIKFFWLNDDLLNTDKLAYAYRYAPYIYKIYQPNLEVGKGKWYSNISTNVHWFGHDYLPETGDLLIVASSNKDALVLRACGFNVIAPHTETQMFSAQQYLEYSKRFKKIIIFYDNDDPGIKRAEIFSHAYNLDYIYLEDLSTKDPYEFMKQYDLETLKDWIKQWV